MEEHSVPRGEQEVQGERSIGRMWWVEETCSKV